MRTTKEDIGSWYIDTAGDYFRFEKVSPDKNASYPIYGTVFLQNLYDDHKHYKERYSSRGMPLASLDKLARKLDDLEVELLGLNDVEE